MGHSLPILNQKESIMRNLDSNELQHVYGGGKSCGHKSRSHGKSHSKRHSRSRSKSHSKCHGKSHSRRKGSGHCHRG
jgi:hypothetical protein